MPSLSRPARPSRADGTLLPAVLAGVLGCLVLAQLAITDTVELPNVGPVGGGAGIAAIADPGARAAPPAILARPIFAPAGGSTSDAGGAVGDPLDGAAFLGSVGLGRVRYAIVRLPDGATRRVSIGASVAGWRLVGLTAEAALLARDGERLTRVFGATSATNDEGQQAPVEDQ